MLEKVYNGAFGFRIPGGTCSWNLHNADRFALFELKLKLN